MSLLFVEGFFAACFFAMFASFQRFDRPILAQRFRPCRCDLPCPYAASIVGFNWNSYGQRPSLRNDSRPREGGGKPPSQGPGLLLLREILPGEVPAGPRTLPHAQTTTGFYWHRTRADADGPK